MDLTDFPLQILCRATVVEENIVFSPLSITMALLLIHQGANGNTKKQINLKIFGEMSQDDQILSRILNMTAALHNWAFSQNITFTFANKIFVDENFPISHKYSLNIKNMLDADTENLAILKSPSQSTTVVNKWAEEKTNGKIMKLFDTFDRHTFLVLASVIYFKVIFRFYLFIGTQVFERFRLIGNCPFGKACPGTRHSFPASLSNLELSL